MHETAKRLLDIGLEKGCKDFSEVVIRLGGTHQVATNWKARGVAQKAIIKAQEIFGANPVYIKTGRGEKYQTSYKTNHQATELHAKEPGDEYVSVERVLFKLSAGCTGYQVEHIEGNGPPVFFRRDWIERHNYNPSKLLAVKINGSSMEPGLYDSDMVVINTQDTTPHDGDVFAANYEGELVIKRLKRDAGEWWLSSDNPDKRRFPDKRCDSGVIILGRIIYKQSERI